MRKLYETPWLNEYKIVHLKIYALFIMEISISCICPGDPTVAFCWEAGRRICGVHTVSRCDVKISFLLFLSLGLFCFWPFLLKQMLKAEAMYSKCILSMTRILPLLLVLYLVICCVYVFLTVCVFKSLKAVTACPTITGFICQFCTGSLSSHRLPLSHTVVSGGSALFLILPLSVSLPDDYQSSFRFIRLH